MAQKGSGQTIGRVIVPAGDEFGVEASENVIENLGFEVKIFNPLETGAVHMEFAAPEPEGVNDPGPMVSVPEASQIIAGVLNETAENGGNEQK